MITLNNYLNEALINKNSKVQIYKYSPKNTFELRRILEIRLKEDKNANLNDIDVSNITDMTYQIDATEKGLFRRLDPHNIDVSEWNMSRVTNISYLFAGCKNFNCDLSKWDVSYVTDMTRTFLKCESFIGKGLSNWNIEEVEHVISMFCGCKNFDGKEIENWKINNGKLTSLSGMFRNCSRLNCNLSKWDVSNIENTYGMFRRCFIFKGKGLEKWNTIKFSDVSEMFEDCNLLDVDLSNWSVKNMKELYDMFYNCYYINFDFNKWELDENADTSDMLEGCNSLKNKPSWYKQ